MHRHKNTQTCTKAQTSWKQCGFNTKLFGLYWVVCLPAVCWTELTQRTQEFLSLWIWDEDERRRKQGRHENHHVELVRQWRRTNSSPGLWSLKKNLHLNVSVCVCRFCKLHRNLHTQRWKCVKLSWPWLPCWVWIPALSTIKIMVLHYHWGVKHDVSLHNMVIQYTLLWGHHYCVLDFSSCQCSCTGPRQLWDFRDVFG